MNDDTSFRFATLENCPVGVNIENFAHGLRMRGYDAKVECLGGNIEGIAIKTKAGYAWVISKDESWMIGGDDENQPHNFGVCATAELTVGLDMLVEWADQMMGFDR